MPRKRKSPSRKSLIPVVLVIALVVVVALVLFGEDDGEVSIPPPPQESGGQPAPPPASGGQPAPPQQGDLHLALGNPSGAASDPAQPNNYLISRPQYSLAYDRDRGIPAWVSWHLDAGDLGPVERYSGAFITDTSLPGGWYRVQHQDYSNSGYDRGHMVPSADRTSTPEDNQATFILTNVLPQAPANNQGPWADLEGHLRDLVRGGSEAYIIAGPQGSAGALAGGRLTVPAAVWKVAVLLPEGEGDLARVSGQTEVIAVLMPNDESVEGQRWDDYRTSVSCIEAATGLDLLAALPDPVEQALAGGDCAAGGGALPATPQPAAGVVITDVEYNPPGDDLAGEYVLLTNGTAPADLAGWTLEDAAGSIYTFPAFTLAAGAEVRVWVGDGQDDGANLYWGNGQPVWNNGGDTATLRDPSGREVSSLSYP